MGKDGNGAPKVLLVEDEALVAMVADENLRIMGFDPIVASTAGEALDAFAQGGPLSLAIIDVGLPDMRGDVLARRLRDTAPSLPILLASGYDSAELRSAFANDSFVRVLAKPYSERQLRDVLTELRLTIDG